MPQITQFVALSDLKVAFSRQGSGFPLVMVHGYTGSKLDFHEQTAPFEDIRTVITPDLRGHGESEHQAPYELAQLTLDLLEFLDALQIPRCDLLGHSMGGMVALQAAAKAPDRFRSLLLMDTSARPVSLMEDNLASELAELVADEGCEGLLPLMRLGAQSAAVRRGIDYLGEDEHWRRIRQKLSQLDPKAFIDFRNALASPIIDDASLTQLTMPVTILVGEADTPFRAPAQHLLKTLPDARLEVIAHAGHSPQYENHDAWRACVRQHLEQVML